MNTLNLMNRLLYLFSLVLQLTWAIDEENNDYDAPGIAMEYKVHIDAGKEDCYWQYVHQGASFYVQMQVLKGGDGHAGLAIRNPKGEIVLPYEWKKSAEYEEASETGGYYSVCIDNQFSRFAPKLINLYLTTFRYDLWEKYTKDIAELDISVENFTRTLKGVDEKIHNMLLFQSNSRARESRDYQLLLDNNIYIQYWSIGLCVSVLATGLAQTYYVKKFFDDKRMTKSGGRA